MLTGGGVGGGTVRTQFQLREKVLASKNCLHMTTVKVSHIDGCKKVYRKWRINE